MNSKQANTLLVSGIASSLLSLPLTWMSITGVEFDGPLASQINGSFGGFTFNVTGLNGSVTFLFSTPIWFVVCIAIAAAVLQLMRASNKFEIPRAATWATAIAGVVWTVVPVGIALLSGKASLGVGSLLGWYGAIAPLVCLLRPPRDSLASRA